MKWPEAVILLTIGGAAALGAWSAERPGVPLHEWQSLDCSKGFEALVAKIKSEPGTLDWGSDDEPTRLIQQFGKEQYYIVTNPTHPAHPAIIHRGPLVYSEGVGMILEGCAFGDRAALDDDLRAYERMDQAMDAEFSCALCSPRWRSPALLRNIESHATPPPL
ncbi:hypothetical protein [Brevundimonas subvibrioides]|uniref:Uncharacterized protein n=1 Tax=Brevundimonas subvibrioides (strain ATCC 15264 / DSM 4735 / LMG 14903 / NBRC 16000 / CB 81) TaxID=633149 RepID=D9QFR0_BRESC|nr:hypothetical protein [Brevundimonas subvibrioides]ADL00624.1 hypothetical protein Bresu_1312 [Brevundimonas subvibrioides ATCC 15264]